MQPGPGVSAKSSLNTNQLVADQTWIDRSSLRSIQGRLDVIPAKPNYAAKLQAILEQVQKWVCHDNSNHIQDEVRQ
jgi:vacuolar-type H+-ATPase catalytic subunit A/Vma1